MKSYPSAFRTLCVCFAALSLFAACSESGAELNEPEFQILQQAQERYRAQDFDRASASLEKLVTDRPRALEAVVLLARCHFFRRDFERSEAVLRAYLELDPENPYALMWLGKTLAAQDSRLEEATEIFRGIVRRDPENYSAHYYLGRCLESKNQIRPALLAYQNALAGETQISRIHRHAGELFKKLNIPERSEAHFRRAQALDSSATQLSAGETPAP